MTIVEDEALGLPSADSADLLRVLCDLRFSLPVDSAFILKDASLTTERLAR